MKKYFAKYLPVEGEIKEGDVYLCIYDNSRFVGVAGKEDLKIVNTDRYTKVKRVLCSRDIQVGDEIRAMWKFDDGSLSSQWGIVTGDGAEDQLIKTPNYWNVKMPTKIERRVYGKGNFGIYGRATGEIMDFFYVIRLPKEHSFKILAEISSEATWIKDGDEFNENEVKLYWQPGGHGSETWNLVSIDHLPIDFIKETKPDLVAKIICPHCKHFH